MKSVIRYPGSKWAIADWIIQYFPEHHTYLEPFFGSGAVFFRKSRSHIETINDLDGEVVNFFNQVKDNLENLSKEIYFTPYARDEYERAYRENPEDKLRRAVNFCIRLNMGYGFRTNGEKVGWKRDVQGRERAYAAEDWKSLPKRLTETAERLRGVQIENRPAIELIQDFNYKTALIYCDPPYLLETRSQKQYAKGMTDQDHKDLLEVLRNHKGYAIISGYESKLYDDILHGWHKKETVSRTQSGEKKKEVLWMNFEPEWQQMSIFDYRKGKKYE